MHLISNLKIFLLPGLFTVWVGYTGASVNQVKEAPEKRIGQMLTAEADSFLVSVNTFRVTAEKEKVNGKTLQQLFLQTRLAYKKFEWGAEYFTPTITRLVNGPPVPDVELPNRVFDPAGLQVIEGFLFPKYDPSRKEALIHQLRLLQSQCQAYKIYFNNIDLSSWQVFDAARLEIFRVLILGITGFDNPLSLNSMRESAASLMGLQTILASYKEAPDSLFWKLNAAVDYLLRHTDFNTFNRADFITTYGNELTIQLARLQQELHIPVVKYNRLLNQEALTLFDENAFNADAYAPGTAYFTTDRKITLGKKLFADPALSGTGTRSCVSCHQPEKAFTDGRVKNTVINDTTRLLPRNTPTLLNAALQPAQFYDLRAITLEEQVSDVIRNKNEMHGSLDEITTKLWQDKTYRQLFTQAYPENDSNSIDTLEVTNAISAYIRSLTRLNSRFDKYMRGDKTAMNKTEINGFNLFMGKGKCATCHYMPLFNGTLAPKYLEIESEVIGVPLTVIGNTIDPDMGRSAVLNIECYQHAFKTTTVRNAASTAPYMHNGVFTTLEEVIDFYNKGGGAGMGLKVDNQTLSPDKLHLTAKEKRALIAFIKSLDAQPV